jgi:serine/threonine protein kinase
MKSHKGVKVTLESKLNSINLQRVEKNLFNYMYIIGKGGFGKVWKVEHKKTKNQYAMKEMLKSMYF